MRAALQLAAFAILILIPTGCAMPGKNPSLIGRTPEISEAIMEGRLIIGMNRDEARAAWGNPRRVHTLRTSSGVREQWVWEPTQYSRYYAYFDDGLLTATSR